MTTDALDRIAQRQPARLGQATAVEQSRAVAEVEAAVVVAKRFPRDVQAAVSDMEFCCSQLELAEVAFFTYERGGEAVEGPSIHLARELARIWGNMQYGVHEMVRDDARGQSEMLAFAWDVQTGSRNSVVFIVPHIRDTRKGPKQLTDMRDIYENNANNGARRVREAIFAELPKWFTRQAEERCRQALRVGDGKPDAERIADVLSRFAKLGVTAAQLEQHRDRPPREWTKDDLAKLHVVYSSLKRGELTKDAAFPQQNRVTAADITGDDDPAAATPPPGNPDTPRRATDAAIEKMQALINSLHLGGVDDERAVLLWLGGEPWTFSTGQVRTVTTTLNSYIEHAGGDLEEARTAIWVRYNEMHPDKSSQ